MSCIEPADSSNRLRNEALEVLNGVSQTSGEAQGQQPINQMPKPGCGLGRFIVRVQGQCGHSWACMSVCQYAKEDSSMHCDWVDFDPNWTEHMDWLSGY